MPNPFVKYEGSTFGLNIIEERSDRVFIERTGQWEDRPYFHGASTAIGDFALVDFVDIVDPATGKVTGQKEVERRDEKGFVIYDQEAYLARWAALIEPAVGKDHAPIMAGLAFKTAELEAVRLQVVAAKEQLVADRDAMAADIDARQKAALKSIVDKHDAVTRAIAAEMAGLNDARAQFDADVVAAQDILARAAAADAVATEFIQPETKE